MELLAIGVLALLVIAGSGVVGARLGVAAPLILVLVGIVISLVPSIPDVEVDPEWILAGVLPPLLYSASVSMPSMNFRREFGAIGGLSVVLVVLTSLVLGFFLSWAVPGLDLAWGIALGAVISPTDAVATSIAKRVGVSPRVMAMLEGESLLNDASALVILRTATLSAAAAFSVWQTVGRFAFAVVVAAVIGLLVGWANLWVRSRTTDPTTNTVLSFTVPFIASLPAEALGASGLVAAVVTGVVTGWRAPRVLSPQHRLSDAQNWRTVELVLEGAVFLLMGLQLSTILSDVREEHEGIGTALLLAAGALVLTLLVRAAYVTPLMAGLKKGHERSRRMRTRIEEMNADLAKPDASDRFARRGPGGRTHPMDLERFATRLRRGLADVEYFLATPLGWRDGGVLVWAGMRGAVTVAAAQTLPENTPSRSLLILIAFAVATMSLVVQGGTLARFVAVIRPSAPDHEREAAERTELLALLTSVGEGGAVETIVRQRTVLLDARDEGTFDAEMLAGALDALDAQQISLEARGDQAATRRSTTPPGSGA